MQSSPTPLTVYKASAGSGKTFTLATEYIKLLVRNPMNYRQILAVTFTNKATEEMKMRILSQLYGIWKQLPSSRQYADKVCESLNGEYSRQQIAERAGQALHLLLHNFSYFRVETIDSFFQSVMRNLARELNLTSNLRVGLNDVQVEEMAIDQLIDSLSSTNAMLQWLMHYIMDNIGEDRSWNVIGGIKKFGRTIFRDYYKTHSRQLTPLMEEKGFFEHYQQELRKMRSQAAERMKSIADRFFDELEGAGLDVSDLSYGRSGVASLFIKLRAGVFDETVLTKRAADCLEQPEKWYTKSSKKAQQIHQLASDSLGALLQQAFSEQPRQWKLYKSADLTLRHLSQLRLLGRIEKKVRELNEEQNRFLLSDTQQLLHELIDGSDSPFIFEKIGTQLEHIMIDEFQDTSTVQWKNFKVLLQETMSHKGSENLIVGDIKQSIYRWRSGDWRLLAGIRHEFPAPEQTVRVEPLATNYRSARRIVDFNNAFFTSAAQQEDVKAYDDVVQHVPDKRGDEGCVEVTLLPADGYEQQTLDAIAEKTRHLLASGVDSNDIAILVRANSLIPLIANYLLECLPSVNVVSDEAFRLDASSAVVTIVQALRHLAHPEDIIAKAYLEKAAGGEIGDPLPEDYSAELLQYPLYEIAEKLFAIFHLERQGSQSAYLCAFFDQLADFAADNGSDIDAFLKEWDETICGKTIQSPQTDGIRLISIHKSKGLEFPHVIIPFCDWRLEMPDVLWCTPDEPPFDRLPLAPIDFSQKGMKGTIYDHDYEEEHQQNVVDNLNLLYVAFTRAGQGLYVIGKRKASAASRSALVETVIRKMATEGVGNLLSGEQDEEASLIYKYVSPKPQTKAEANGHCDVKAEKNPFLQPSLPMAVPVAAFPAKAVFRQSDKSREFAAGDEEDEEQSHRHEYIKLGNVLHSVLSTIRTADDIEPKLHQMESDGILYGEGQLARTNIVQMLRKRLSHPKVEEWFRPGRWTLFNECTILSIDSTTDRLVERRPDRVMTDGRETVVVDFKFGNEREEHHEQVQQYMSLLDKMGHRNVKGFLWYVYSNKIIEVVA